MDTNNTHIDHAPTNCSKAMLGLQDALELLKGKWKVHILGYLNFGGKKHFNEMQRDIRGISAKMLSKELKELEVNKLVKRTVMETFPVTVEYELTTYGGSLQPLMVEIARWGAEHRKYIMQKE